MLPFARPRRRRPPRAAGPFESVTDATLADALGDIDAGMEALKARQGLARAEFVRRKLDSARGERFAVTRSLGSQTRLDTKAVKAEMGADWYAARSRTSSTATFRVFPAVAGEAKAA